MFTIPIGGNNLLTSVVLEKSPAFYFTITLDFKTLVDNLIIKPNILTFDSGSLKKSF